jgi:hypothetical protein
VGGIVEILVNKFRKDIGFYLFVCIYILYLRSGKINKICIFYKFLCEFFNPPVGGFFYLLLNIDKKIFMIKIVFFTLQIKIKNKTKFKEGL